MNPPNMRRIRTMWVPGNTELMLSTFLISLAAIACAVVGGVFFAFSFFVMRALARIPPPQGIAAMQSINIVAITPIFMTAVFGTAVACLALAAYAVMDWRGPASAYLLAGCLSYLLGTIVVTMAGNVPLNNTLAAADPNSNAGAGFWLTYVHKWTAWNHVRTASGIVAAALLLTAISLS
jgi:uncharacterized membrane protein